MADIANLQKWASARFKTSSTVRVGDDGRVVETFAKAYPSHVEPGEADRTCRFVISTGDVDRDGDTIDPRGWQLDNFKKGGSVLWAHDPSQPPVAKPIDVWVEGGKLKSVCQFATADEYAFADTVYKLIKGGYLRATSVGFRPIKWVDADRNTGRMPMDFQEQELMEFSIVPVPANPNALLEAKSKYGAQVMAPYGEWIERSLDTYTKSGLLVSRDVLEAAYGALKTSTTTSAAPAVEEAKATESIVTSAEEPAMEAKAGRALSKANAAKIKEAMDCHKQAMDFHKQAMDAHQKGLDCMKAFMADNDQDDDSDESDKPGDGDKSAEAAQKAAPAAAAADADAKVAPADATPAAPLESQQAKQADGLPAESEGLTKDDLREFLKSAVIEALTRA